VLPASWVVVECGLQLASAALCVTQFGVFARDLANGFEIGFRRLPCRLSVPISNCLLDRAKRFEDIGLAQSSRPKIEEPSVFSGQHAASGQEAGGLVSLLGMVDAHP